MANPWDLIDKYQTENPDDIQAAWRASRIARNQGGSDPQALADAEHNLWAQYYASKSPWKAVTGMAGPAVHHAKKSLYQTLGIPDASQPTARQLEMGQTGAWAGLKKQLVQANLLRKQ